MWLAIASLLLLLPSGLALPFCLCAAECVHVEESCCSEEAHGPASADEREHASGGCCGESCVLELGETQPQSQAPHVVRLLTAPMLAIRSWPFARAPEAKAPGVRRHDRVLRPPPVLERSTVLLI